jgi:hypothetical protein
MLCQWRVPKSVQPIEFFPPAFYLDKLGLWVAGVPNIHELASSAAGPSSHRSPLLYAAVLAGVTLVFGVLAIRRLPGASGQRSASKAQRSVPLATQV